MKLFLRCMVLMSLMILQVHSSLSNINLNEVEFYDNASRIMKYFPNVKWNCWIKKFKRFDGPRIKRYFNEPLENKSKLICKASFRWNDKTRDPHFTSYLLSPFWAPWMSVINGKEVEYQNNMTWIVEIYISIYKVLLSNEVNEF